MLNVTFQRLCDDFYKPRPQDLNPFNILEPKVSFHNIITISHTVQLVSSEDSNFVSFHYMKN